MKSWLHRALGGPSGDRGEAASVCVLVPSLGFRCWLRVPSPYSPCLGTCERRYFGPPRRLSLFAPMCRGDPGNDHWPALFQDSFCSHCWVLGVTDVPQGLEGDAPSFLSWL